MLLPQLLRFVVQSVPPVVPELTRFRLTNRVERSVCGSRISCYPRDATCLCLSVCLSVCHRPVLYWNGSTDPGGFGTEVTCGLSYTMLERNADTVEIKILFFVLWSGHKNVVMTSTVATAVISLRPTTVASLSQWASTFVQHCGRRAAPSARRKICMHFSGRSKKLSS